MSEYELKPNDVDAKQVSWETADEIAQWCGGVVVTEYSYPHGEPMPGINVPTLTGMVRASEGDYVIRHASGQFQKRSRYAFESEYRRKGDQ